MVAYKIGDVMQAVHSYGFVQAGIVLAEVAIRLARLFATWFRPSSTALCSSLPLCHDGLVDNALEVGPVGFYKYTVRRSHSRLGVFET